MIDSDSDVQILGLAFKGINIRQLGLLLLLASFYAIFTLYIEWRSETRVIYHGRNGLHRDLKERLKAAEDGLRSFTDDAVKLVSEHRALAKVIREGGLLARVDRTVERVKGNFTDRLTR